MKIFGLFLCVVLAAFAFAQANDCVINGHPLKIGETYSVPGKCELVECNAKDSFSAKTCASVESLKPCKLIPQDNSKPYPQCCPQHEC